MKNIWGKCHGDLYQRYFRGGTSGNSLQSFGLLGANALGQHSIYSSLCSPKFATKIECPQLQACFLIYTCKGFTLLGEMVYIGCINSNS